jgi:opacity protein-like surface antigen
LSPRRLAAILLLFALAPPRAASADWFLTPFVGAKLKGQTNVVDLERGASNTKFTLGVSGAFLSEEVLGFEGEFGYYPRFFERSGGSELIARSNVATLSGNVLVAVPKFVTRDSLRPYAVAGLGLIHVGIDDVLGILPVDTNLLGLNVGGGVMGRLTDRTSMRFEVRHFRNIDRESSGVPGFGATRVSFWRVSLGVALMGNLF